MAEQAGAEVLLNGRWPQSYWKTANSWLIRTGWNAGEWNAISWINGRWAVGAGVADNADDTFMFWYCGSNRIGGNLHRHKKGIKKNKQFCDGKLLCRPGTIMRVFSLIQVKSEKNHKKKRATFTNENKLKKYFWSNIVYLHHFLDGNQVSWGGSYLFRVFLFLADIDTELTGGSL